MAYLYDTSAVIVNTEATDAEHYVMFEDSTSGIMTPRTDSGLHYNPLTETLSANIFKSEVAQGTAPLTVTSTTVVANLNADKVDGMDAATAGTASTVAARDSSGNLTAANTFNMGNTASIQYNATTKSIDFIFA